LIADALSRLDIDEKPAFLRTYPFRSSCRGAT
jgi:hypothetical protein